MKTGFSEAFLSRLNAQHSGGVFVKAAELVVDVNTTLRIADAHDSFVFNGQTYMPRPMQWSGLGNTSQMTLPAIRVTVPNVTGEIDTIMNGAELAGHDITLHIVHLDLLGTVTDDDRVKLQVLMVEWDWQQGTFTCGINMGLTDMMPRHIITREEFPGTPDAFRRASIL